MKIAFAILAILLIAGVAQATEIQTPLAMPVAPNKPLIAPKHQAPLMNDQSGERCQQGIISSQSLRAKGYDTDLSALVSGTSTWTGKNSTLSGGGKTDVLPSNTDGWTLLLHKDKRFYSEKVLVNGRTAYKHFGYWRQGEPVFSVSCGSGRDISRDSRCGNPSGGHYVPPPPEVRYTTEYKEACWPAFNPPASQGKLTFTPASLGEAKAQKPERARAEGFPAQSWSQPHAGASGVYVESWAAGWAKEQKLQKICPPKPPPPPTCDPGGHPPPEQNPSGNNLR